MMLTPEEKVLPRPRVLSALGLTAAAGVSAALVLLPRLALGDYALHVLILLFLSVAAGEAWNLIGGYAGQYSVGHAAYYGLGAYTTLLLLQSSATAPWWGACAGVGVAVAAALLVGTLCFRLRGPYFVLASIAVTEILRLGALEWKQLTNGAEGILAAPLPPLRLGGWLVTDFASKLPFYYAGLGLAGLAIAVDLLVQRSRLGYRLLAIREDQDAAASLGIPLARTKNVALALSAALTALAGSLHAIYVQFIDPATVLGLDLSVQIVLICIIGGVGTPFGPVLGALLLVPLSEALRSNLLTDALVRSGLVRDGSPAAAFLQEHLSHAHALVYGVLVVAVILFMPDGLLGFLRKLLRPRPRLAATAPAELEESS